MSSDGKAIRVNVVFESPKASDKAMQKRELSKGTGTSSGSGSSAPPPAKRGRLFGSGTSNAAASVDSLSAHALLGPSGFSEQNRKKIVQALQSGQKSELTWAFKALTLLSFIQKDDVRRDATPVLKTPGLLDALLHVIDDWCCSMLDEDGLFNRDDEGRAEKQLCAVTASNILRNLSFMAENEVILAKNRHCLETLFQCMADYVTEDEELVTNTIETVVSLAHLLDLGIFSSAKPSFIKITAQQAVQAIMGVLRSGVRAWHSAAAEILGRLIIIHDNEQFILPLAQQICSRLVDIVTFPDADAQAAAVGALQNFAEVSVECRLKLGGERWAVGRLMKVVRTPHPVPEVGRKAAAILEKLASEPQNKPFLLAFESAFAEMAFSDGKYADTFARILCALTSRPDKLPATPCIWGK